MEQIALGLRGPMVSTWSLGTMTYGNQTQPDDAFRQMDMARAHGITLFDTAEMYPVNPTSAETRGRTEEIVGDWLASRGRADTVIATKITGVGSNVMEGGTPLVTPDRLRDAVEQSLRRLRTDHIDLYQLHWPNRGSYHFRQHWGFVPPQVSAAAVRDEMRALLETAAELIAAGKIGQFALSNETAWGLMAWLRLADEGLPRVASIQNEYSLLCRLADTDLAEVCALEQVPILAWSPLAAGLLTGKYAGDVVPPLSRRVNAATLGGRITPQSFAAVDAYVALARAHGLDPMHMALAWLTQRPFAVIPILGATSADQLAAQLPGAGLRLSPEVLAGIDAIHRAHPVPF